MISVSVSQKKKKKTIKKIIFPSPPNDSWGFAEEKEVLFSFSLATLNPKAEICLCSIVKASRISLSVIQSVFQYYCGSVLLSRQSEKKVTILSQSITVPHCHYSIPQSFNRHTSLPKSVVL